MAKSKIFGKLGPKTPHLARRRGGTSGEIVDLREDIDATMVLVENSTYIADPTAARNANFTALQVWNTGDAIVEVAPTATRTFDPRSAPYSMAFTLWKSNTAAFGITIDVTTGGTTGWTTDAGLNTNFTVPNSASAAAGQWLIRIDKPNKRVSVIPAS